MITTPPPEMLHHIPASEDLDQAVQARIHFAAWVGGMHRHAGSYLCVSLNWA